MFSILLIAALHLLHILWSENPNKDCYVASVGEAACYLPAYNEIVLGYKKETKSRPTNLINI